MDKETFYQTLMGNNPTQVGKQITNSKGQVITFYEDPMNPGFTVVAACHKLKLAGHTDFFDCEDFGEDSEYNPVFVGNDLKCEYEL